MANFDKSVLAKYGITGTTEVLYNPSYEVLFNEETKERRLRIEKRNKENTNKQKTAKTFCNFSDLHYLCKNLGKRLSWNRSKNKHKITKKNIQQ